MRLATTNDPKTVSRLRAKLGAAREVKCDKVAVFIKGPGTYVTVIDVSTQAKAEKTVRDCNVLRPTRGYRAFIRPLRFDVV